MAGNLGNSTGIVEIPVERGITESWVGRIMEGQGWPRERTDGAVGVMESWSIGVVAAAPYCRAEARVLEEWL